jgi:hypothetical protein
MEQKRLMRKTIRRSHLRNRPGGHFRSSQSASAQNLGPLAAMEGMTPITGRHSRHKKILTTIKNGTDRF